MVNVRFGNYEQFKEFFSKAPRNVQNILYKAYPEFAQKLTNEYMSAQKKLAETVKQTQGVVNKATQAIRGNTPKALGTTKEVASTTGKGLGLLSKAKLVPGIVGGAWTMLDPKTTWNQKALGAMMMVPQTAPYATAGLITTALAPKAIDNYYERKLQDDPAYQNAVNGNLVNLSAPATNITSPQQRNTYSNPMMQLVYNEAVRQGVDPALALALVERESGFNPNARGDGGKSFGLFQIHTPSHPDYTGGLDPQKNAEYGIRFLKNLLNTYSGDVNKALWAYNAGSGNLQKGILPASTKSYISGITNRMGFYGSPQANNYQPTGAIAQTNYTASVPQTRQNVQQPTLNINQDKQYLNQNQQALNPIVGVSKLIGEVPDYQTWNLNNQLQLQDLQNNINQINQPQGVQPMQNQAGNEALLQYLKMQNEKQAQAQQANEVLLRQYQEATRADALQNQANQMINSFGALGRQDTPVYYVGANGNLNRLDLGSNTNVRPLPTNTSSNIDKLLGEMQIRGQAKVGDDVTAQVLQAQALGNLYNQDPLLYLNKDIAQELIKGQNTLANTSLTGTERRKDIPLNAQAKVIEENTKTAGKLAEAKATAYYNYILEGMKQQGMNDRQAQLIASQQAQAVYNQEMQNYRLGQELDYRYQALPFNRETQLMVADAYANRSQPDQELQDQYKRSQIYATGSTFANPQQQQAYWNYVTGGGVNPTNIYGTTPAEDNIFQNIRNRK